MFFDQKSTVHVLSGAGLIISLGLLWRYRTSLPGVDAIWPSWRVTDSQKPPNDKPPTSRPPHRDV